MFTIGAKCNVKQTANTRILPPLAGCPPAILKGLAVAKAIKPPEIKAPTVPINQSACAEALLNPNVTVLTTDRTLEESITPIEKNPTRAIIPKIIWNLYCTPPAVITTGTKLAFFKVFILAGIVRVGI